MPSMRVELRASMDSLYLSYTSLIPINTCSNEVYQMFNIYGILKLYLMFDIIHNTCSIYPYANHGAGIFTYKTGQFLG